MVSLLNYRKTLACCLLIAAALSCQMAFSSERVGNTSESQVISGIVFKNGFLKVSVENQQFRKIMNEISLRAKIQIIINGPADEDEELTISFDYLPLEKGLKKLLTARNHVFLYRSNEGVVSKRSSSLVKVLVFSKPEGWIAAASEGLGQGEPLAPEQQIMTMNEKKNQIQDKLDEIFQNLSLNGIDFDQNKQINAALEKMQAAGIFREVVEYEDAISQFFQDAVAPNKKINKALQGIEGAETYTKDHPK
jgi:hypothetical protein